MGSDHAGPSFQHQFWGSRTPGMWSSKTVSKTVSHSCLLLRRNRAMGVFTQSGICFKTEMEMLDILEASPTPNTHRNTAVKMNTTTPTTPQTRVPGHQQSSTSSPLLLSSCQQQTHRLEMSSSEWRGEGQRDPPHCWLGWRGPQQVTTHPGRGKAPDRLFLS